MHNSIINHCIRWCISKHQQTNHLYDDYLPYEFHLRMVHTNYKKFDYLLDNLFLINRFTGYNESLQFNNFNDTTTLRKSCKIAAYGHDLLEDTRTSYNDVKNVLGVHIADIIYAVTNEKGKNRAERANSKYYEGIRNTPGAVFIKLCDRIANVEYSKMTISKMYNTYKEENESFIANLETEKNKKELAPMFDYLKSLFN